MVVTPVLFVLVFVPNNFEAKELLTHWPLQ